MVSVAAKLPRARCRDSVPGETAPPFSPCFALHSQSGCPVTHVCAWVRACVCVHATSSPLGPFGPPPRDIWQGLETFFVVLMGRGRENYYHLAGEAGDAAERLECIGWMVPHNRRCRCSSVCCAEAEPWCTDTVRTHVEYTE